MSEELLFAAVRDDDGNVVFQINPDTLASPAETGALIYHLQTHLAQASVKFGKSPDYLNALSAIMNGASEELNRVIADAQLGQNGGQ